MRDGRPGTQTHNRDLMDPITLMLLLFSLVLLLVSVRKCRSSFSSHLAGRSAFLRGT